MGYENMMGWGGGWGGGNMFGFGMIGLVLVVVVVVLLVARSRSGRTDPAGERGEDRALAILRERYELTLAHLRNPAPGAVEGAWGSPGWPHPNTDPWR
jgi:hypothetical protein